MYNNNSPSGMLSNIDFNSESPAKLGAYRPRGENASNNGSPRDGSFRDQWVTWRVVIRG